MNSNIIETGKIGSAAPPERLDDRRGRFYTGFAIAALVMVFAGFARTYYLRPFTNVPSLPPLVVLHALLFTSWNLLLITQTVLAAKRRLDLHRHLGVVGGLLAVTMATVGFMTSIAAARRGYLPGGMVTDPLVGLTIPLRDLLFFTTFTSLGIYYRRRSEAHKRLLLLATVNLLPAALGRIPGLPQGTLVMPLMIAFLLAGPLHDRVMRGRVHRVYVWGGLITIFSMVAQFPLGQTVLWRVIAEWLVR